MRKKRRLKRNIKVLLINISEIFLINLFIVNLIDNFTIYKLILMLFINLFIYCFNLINNSI